MNQESEENPEEISDAVKKSLRSLLQTVEKEDKGDRASQLKFWKEADAMWTGIQSAFYSELAGGVISFREGIELTPDVDVELDEVDKLINVYRATGETIIAALATGVPKTRFFPADADNPEDIITSQSYSKIASLIERHNNARLKILKCLFYAYKHGFVAIHNHSRRRREYGIATRYQVEHQLETVETTECEDCGYPIDQMEDGAQCPSCGSTNVASYAQQMEVPVNVVEEQIPKARQVLEVYGPLYIKVPIEARDVTDCGYLILETEQPKAMMMEIYPDLKDKLSGNADDDVDRDYRLESGGGDHIVTVKRVWFRPWQYNSLAKDDEGVEELRERFPEGCAVVFVDGRFAEVKPELMDEHWSIIVNPLDEKIHPDPIGKVVMPIQDMRTDLVNLTAETIAHGIPDVFVDPEVIDVDQLNNQEKRPGTIYPAKSSRPGDNLSNAVTTIKPATLSREVEVFRTSLDRDREFVSGAYPHVFGGYAQTPTRTLGEYESNRTSALQRLSISWMIISHLWSDAISKATQRYKDNLLEDEKFTVRNGNNYKTVHIRMAELQGSIGHVEGETSEEFPSSWAEKRGMLFRLFELNNPQVNSALFHPENVSSVASLLGMPEFYIPGDEDRTKQLFEIQQMVQGQPIQVNPILDNHPVHAEALRAFLNSVEGVNLEHTNPQAFSILLMHLQQHMMQMQPPPGAMPPQGPPQGPPQ